MNRKLHNSLMALVASCGLLAVGLMAATPAPGLHAPEGAALVQMDADADRDLDQDPGSDSSAAANPRALGERERAPARSLRRGRPSVSMPFFSFAPRG